jgi:hypothetical protein
VLTSPSSLQRRYRRRPHPCGAAANPEGFAIFFHGFSDIYLKVSLLFNGHQSWIARIAPCRHLDDTTKYLAWNDVNSRDVPQRYPARSTAGSTAVGRQCTGTRRVVEGLLLLR